MTALRSAILCLLVFVNIDCTRKDSFMSLDGRWLFKVDSLDHGEREQWFAPDLDRSDWAAQDIPAYWDRYNLHGYVGVGWYFREFQIADTSRPLSLYFGGVDDLADVWVNGTKVGSHLEYRYAFSFDISRFVKPGTNTVVVRVDDESGPGGIYKPVEIVPTADVDGLLRTKYSREKARPSADWVKNGIIYEVYLRSFSPEGTIRGLEGRLDELKNLGVTILWLMPIHPVGALNRKGSLGSPYAVQDYYAINPEFGTLDDFKSLVRSVHDRGMRIIIDLVANHTSWDSELLMEHPDWFKKNEEGAIVAPNPDWTDVAQLDYNNHELRKYMVEMMKYWVRDIGIDGYRCDVAELVPTDFWEVARRELDKIRPVLMLAEGTIPEHHIEAFDLSYSWNLYAAMDKVVNGKTPARIFDELLMNEGYEFPAGSLRMRFNTNHDKNAWDNPAVVKFTRQGARATALMAFAFPGIPLVYNGEEVGNSRKLSLFEKVGIDWSRNPDFRTFYRQLTTLRRENIALRDGSFSPVGISGGEKSYAFRRSAAGNDVIVFINFGKSETNIDFDVPRDLQSSTFKEFFSGRTVPAGKRISLKLPPLDFVVLTSRNGQVLQ